jgi:CHAT domain-containing protein
VPIVVLSECGTFIGKVKAEGVWNLPQSLMIARVPCIVVSQWKVEDTSTSELMKGFYKGLRSGEDVVVDY